MNLVIDQGNTVTKVAFFEAGVLIETFLYDIFDVNVCSSLLAHYTVERCIFCSVIHASPEILAYLNNNLPNFMFIDENTLLPINNRYKTPKTLGKDRLAAVVGANEIFPGKNILVVDIGTAITYEFIDSLSNYYGGNISPGISMRFKALDKYTGKLPLIDRYGELTNMGYDTETAIRAGVINGVIYEIRSYIERFSTKYPDIEVVLTGGHTKYIESQLKEPVFVDIDLVLKGLNRILNYNVKE
ncbi:type III pantothenate kinase [Dysgonomonas sp. ZJ709]|uniref:type III pantothenate kinase n=1 Tax=Dysgonomonas sp. ZJ709 TaxID=2709797 RepID=UPI0013EAF3F5|nr:type III pantothenate kinase [Dysgonomonas sp. ZJ709]